MAHEIDEVLLRPGQSVSFPDRDHLLQELDRLDQRVPARHEKRTTDHREHFCILRYLRFLAEGELLPLPVTLTKPLKGQDPPDFVLAWPDGERETFELTDGSTQAYQRMLSKHSKTPDRLVLPLGVNTQEREVAQLWADILFSAFLKKAEGLLGGSYNLDHLLIYDLTGLGLLLPLERGAPLLRRRLQDWHAQKSPAHRFGRVSVLRDLALLLDVCGSGQILRGKSPCFQLSVIKAHDEEDLKKRLRDIDRYCRENSIRHLKTFGSILGDRIVDDFDIDIDGSDLTLFREDSDLDLLVEFEPGTRVTLFDMARMERELGELTGFKVDLRTAEDLSRYFRREVVGQAAELHAARS